MTTISGRHVETLKRAFYAFQYRCGKRTTEGGEYGNKLRIAGYLYAFYTKKERDEFVEANNFTQSGNLKECKAISRKNLPWGWNALDLIEAKNMTELNYENET